MNPAKWHKIEELFNSVLELPVEQRADYLDSFCHDDELRNEVEALLQKAEKEDSFLGGLPFSLGLAILSENKKYSLLGKKIGRYQIISLLGEGGMGEVYLAEDLQLNRQVAIKLLPSYLIEHDESVARFQKEALAASSVSHPNIAHIYETGINENQRYIAMEFVEGTTLRELIRQKKLSLITALDIIWQTADALAAAHRIGITHRDIKPENIMIRRDGYVKVLDFGVAKLAERSASEQDPMITPTRINQHSKFRDLQLQTSGLLMGTMGYISPEQLKNKEVDWRTDIWSLGVVLYEVLSGDKPFKGETAEDIRKAVLHTSPPRIPLSILNTADEAGLQNIVTKMLSKEPVNRYQSLSDVAGDLKQLKQSLEFTQRLSAVELTGENEFSVTAGIDVKTGNSNLITRSKQYWTHQSVSRKMLLLLVFAGFVTFATGISVQYFTRFGDSRRPKFETFSSDSREKWQIATLFGIRKKVHGMIPFVSFAPDSQAVAFVMSGSGTNDIYVKQINRNDPMRLTEGRWNNQTPVWSPDGQQIAFVSNRENKSAIWTVSPTGSAPVLKLNLNVDFNLCQLLKWSNDGKRLYFKKGGTLNTIEIESGEIKNISLPVADTGSEFSISQDEALVAFISQKIEKGKLWIYNLKTGDLIEITEQANQSFSPVILPDNKRLIYSSNKTGASQLYAIDFVNKTPVQITFSDSNTFSSSVSPDGNKIIYLSETETANIFALDLNSKTESRLTEETKLQLFPELSKDKTKLVFQLTSDISNLLNSPFKIKNLATSSETILENQTGFAAQWSPIKDEIAYIRRAGLDYSIWKIDLDNNQTKQLTFDGIGIEGNSVAPFNFMSIPFDWSPDGKKITYISNQSKINNVRVLDSESINSHNLTNNIDQKVKYTSPKWSPDGNKIAFNQSSPSEPNKFSTRISSKDETKVVFQDSRKIRILGWAANAVNLLVSVYNPEYVEIYQLSETAEPKLINKLNKADFFSLTLSSDGQTVAYAARQDGIDNIFSCFLTEGKQKQLTDNKEDSIYFSGISWSADGDRLFYSKQSGSIQISMISDNVGATE